MNKIVLLLLLVLSLVACTSARNIERADVELMEVKKDYLTYEWSSTGNIGTTLEEASAYCKKHVPKTTKGYISKSLAVEELEKCLSSQGWRREVVEIILQD